jgi:hypothetical protein
MQDALGQARELTQVLERFAVERAAVVEGMQGRADALDLTVANGVRVARQSATLSAEVETLTGELEEVLATFQL